MNKLIKESNKKFLISLIIIFTMLSTLAIYQISAIANTPVTAEMGENNTHSIPSGGTYLSLEELDSWYDLFCNQKGTTLPGRNAVVFTAGGQTSDPEVTGRLTQNDIGMRLFEKTLSEPSMSPYLGEYHHLTYGWYRASEWIRCTPLKAYILTEMINNGGNHNESYEQYAWWLTEESNKNKITLEQYRSLAGIVGQEMINEATAFEEYILEVAKASDNTINTVEDLSYTRVVTENLERSINEQGLKGIGEDGVLKFEYPDIEYNPTWDGDIVGGTDEEPTFENVTVSWDGIEQLYKVGPFSIKYIESLYKTANPSEKRTYDESTLITWMGDKYIQFAGVTDATLDTNIKTGLKRGTLDELRNNQNGVEWSFLWLTGVRAENDDAEFPHNEEEFYIAMKYIEDATEIQKVEFDFRYMNAGGSYQILNGTYYEATWSSKSKNNYEYYDCGAENCSGNHRRHVSTTYWVQLTSLSEPKESQELVLAGFICCRWYEPAKLLWAGKDDLHRAKIRIEKVLVDANGNRIEVNENLSFHFRITINSAEGRKHHDIMVRGNSAVVFDQITWKEGEQPPTYEVREIPERNPAGWKFYSIENATGTVTDGRTVTVVCKNTFDGGGKLEIRKEVVNQEGYHVPTYFDFRVYKNGVYDRTVTVGTGMSVILDDFWRPGEPAPTYRVEEIPKAGWEVDRIENASGTLEEGRIVTVIAKNRMIDDNRGRLRIVKIADEKIQDREFEFRVTIGNEVIDNIKISRNTNWEWTSREYVWNGNNAPRYTVYEYPTPDYEGERVQATITPSSGYLGSSTTTTVTVTNFIEWDQATIVIDKQIKDGTTSEEFTFRLTIEGYDPIVGTVKAGTPWTHTIRWKKGTVAPTYRVEEINLPADWELDRIENAEGRLSANSRVNVIIINQQKYKEGRLEIAKILDGNYESAEEFIFKVTVEGTINGTDIEYVTVKAGAIGYTGYFKWEAKNSAPTYKVEEMPKEGSTLKSIQNATGTLKERSESDQIRVVAINKLDEKIGQIIVRKEVIIDDKMQNEAIDGTFTINVRITGTFELNGESVVGGSRTVTFTLRAGETSEPIVVKWYGDNAPTYTVTETELPEGWNLMGISPSRGELIEDETIEVAVLNSFNARIIIDLTMRMGGDVWEDVPQDPEGKNTPGTEPNGWIDENELKIDGVEVNIYRVVYSGNNEIRRELARAYELDGETPLTFPLITENGGRWDAPRVSVPALSDDEKDNGYTARYDVEFIYDGQTYEPTKFLATSERDGSAKDDIQGKAERYKTASTTNRDRWAKDSMALDYDREEVDNRVAQVAGDRPIDANGETIGKVIGSAGEHRIDYVSTDYSYGINDASRKISTVKTLNLDGTALAVFKAKARTSVGYLLYPFDDRIHLESYDKYIDELGAVEVYKYSATYNYLLHINLGLVHRLQANVSATKDLYDANVVVNEKLLNYRFNTAIMYLAEVTNNYDLAKSILNKQIEIEDIGIEYKLGLYETDFYYRAEMYREDSELYTALDAFYRTMNLPVESTELDIYLTYKISLYNESSAYGATINLVEDYFDSSLKLVNTTVEKYVQTADGITIDGVTNVANPSDYTVTRQTNTGAVTGGREGTINWNIAGSNIVGSNGVTYNKMSTDSLKGVKLASGERIDIYVTFEVSKADYHSPEAGVTVSDCITLGDKYNIVEIGNYSTYYSDTYHPEKAGQVAGKIDKNSAPANVNIPMFNDKSWYEDDTEVAPVLKIELNQERRELNGIAWDDTKTTPVENGFGQKVGDGIRDEDEFKIGDLTTQLVEKVRVQTGEEGTKNTYTEYDFIWPTSESFDFLGGTSIETLTGFSSETATAKVADGEGLDVGQYNFDGVPAGNYVVRFIYGDKEIETAAHLGEPGYNLGDGVIPAIYNGQDYKTTTYQTGFDDIVDDGNGYVGNEWHDLTNKELAEASVNDSRDDEARRLEVIAKSRIMTNVNGEILHTANYSAEELKDVYDEDATHEKLLDGYWMKSDTAKINMEIENTNKIKDQMLADGTSSLKSDVINNEHVTGGLTVKSIAGKALVNGVEKGTRDFEYVIEDIDFGLIERSRTELVLDKQIESISLITSDGKTILHAEFDIEYELAYNPVTGTSDWEAKVELNKDKSTGTEQLQYLNKVEDRDFWSQNFRYINVDEIILQGITIKIGYVFTALDVGEVDRVGKLEVLKDSEILPQAEALRKANAEYTKTKKSAEFDDKTICGEYVGSIYYRGAKGSSTDGIVTTKVRQMIDYVDNNAVFTAASNTGVNKSWRVLRVSEINAGDLPDGRSSVELDERIIEIDEETGIKFISDDKGISYDTENRNNIVISIDNAEDIASHTNKDFIIELVPHSAVDNGHTGHEYMSGMSLETSRYISQQTDADDMNFDNIAEIIKFENTVGRRDMEAVPGNAHPKTLSGVFEVALQERDSSATEIVTLTPPTGIAPVNVIRLQLLIVTAIALVIVCVGIVVIKKKVLN